MEKIRDLIVYLDDGYNAFPSIVRTKDGGYLAAFRHAPDRRAAFNGLVTHCDDESVVFVIKSGDGTNWGAPKTIRWLPGCGNQDPCLNVLSDGTIILTTFFWKFLNQSKRPMLEKVLLGTPLMHDVMGMTTYFAGSYTYISNDGGDTWAGPHLINESYAMHGQCAELPDGTVLAPMYGVAEGTEHSQVALFASTDKGVSWTPYSYVTGPLGERRRADEPTLIRTQSGKLFCFIRTADGMYYCHSCDDGLSFSKPIATDLPADVPYHALQLPDGRIFLSYGRRVAPYGIRAQLLDGECGGEIAAKNETVLRDDGLGGDISYNFAAVLPNGDVLSIYYFHTKDMEQRRHIAATIVRV